MNQKIEINSIKAYNTEVTKAFREVFGEYTTKTGKKGTNSPLIFAKMGAVRPVPKDYGLTYYLPITITKEPLGEKTPKYWSEVEYPKWQEFYKKMAQLQVTDTCPVPTTSTHIGYLRRQPQFNDSLEPIVDNYGELQYSWQKLGYGDEKFLELALNPSYGFDPSKGAIDGLETIHTKLIRPKIEYNKDTNTSKIIEPLSIEVLTEETKSAYIEYLARLIRAKNGIGDLRFDIPLLADYVDGKPKKGEPNEIVQIRVFGLNQFRVRPNAANEAVAQIPQAADMHNILGNVLNNRGSVVRLGVMLGEHDDTKPTNPIGFKLNYYPHGTGLVVKDILNPTSPKTYPITINIFKTFEFSSQSAELTGEDMELYADYGDEEDMSTVGLTNPVADIATGVSVGTVPSVGVASAVGLTQPVVGLDDAPVQPAPAPVQTVQPAPAPVQTVQPAPDSTSAVPDLGIDLTL